MLTSGLEMTKTLSNLFVGTISNRSSLVNKAGISMIFMVMESTKEVLQTLVFSSTEELIKNKPLQPALNPP